MPGAKAARKPIGNVRRWALSRWALFRWALLLWVAKASCCTAWAEEPPSRNVTASPQTKIVELHLPAGFSLPDTDKFIIDLRVGLEQDGLVVDAEPQSHPTAVARAIVTLTEPEPEVLRIVVVANDGKVHLSREVRRSELPTSGQGLALAVLVEELVRASLAEAAAPSQEVKPKSAAPPAPPPSTKPEPPLARSQGKPLERYLGLGPLGLIFTDSSVYLGGSGVLGLGTRRWRVELTFAYCRLLDVTASSGTTHGELGFGGARGHFNLVSGPRLWLGPFATFNAGMSTFWATSQAGYASHSLTGPFVSVGGGLRLGVNLQPIDINLDVALAAPIAGVTATVDNSPISSTASPSGSALLNVGVRL